MSVVIQTRSWTQAHQLYMTVAMKRMRTTSMTTVWGRQAAQEFRGKRDMWMCEG